MVMSPKKETICASCDEKIRDRDGVYFGDAATHYEGKPLCETCYSEDEPIATVYYRDEEEPRFITHARNDTEGDFKATWHSTDPWRGYFEVESERYAKVFSDTILSYHESEAMLKELNDQVMEKYKDAGIDFARVFPRTSNLFATGYDIWVDRDFEKLFIAHAMLEQVKREVGFNNPLYSTGILFDRETLGKLQSILGDKYKIEKDSDVMKLVEEKGEGLLDEIKAHYQAERKQEEHKGDANG